MGDVGGERPAAKVLDPRVEIQPRIVGGPEGVIYHGPAPTDASKEET